MDGSQLIARHKEHARSLFVPLASCASMEHRWIRLNIVPKSEREINAVTDNPTVFPEDDEVVLQEISSNNHWH
ncbi:MAG: hypothetical protein R2779_03555 [Crocinitomicaceae bacterium]